MRGGSRRRKDAGGRAEKTCRHSSCGHKPELPYWSYEHWLTRNRGCSTTSTVLGTFERSIPSLGKFGLSKIAHFHCSLLPGLSLATTCRERGHSQGLFIGVWLTVQARYGQKPGPTSHAEFPHPIIVVVSRCCVIKIRITLLLGQGSDYANARLMRSAGRRLSVPMYYAYTHAPGDASSRPD